MTKPKTFTHKVWGIWRDLKDKEAKGQFSRATYTRDGWLHGGMSSDLPNLRSPVALWISRDGARDGRDCDEDGVVRERAKPYGTLAVEADG